MYKPCKGEHLNDITTRMTAPDVQLHFLFKRESSTLSDLRESVKEYSAPNIPYYTEPAINHEAKWRYFSSELRTEFYFEMLQQFVAPDENLFGIFTGIKCMLAAKVLNS